MALDFQQVRDQIRQLGEQASQRAKEKANLREKALATLESYATDLEHLRQKVRWVVQSYEPSLRCALPAQEALNAAYPLPQPRGPISVLAADGSQILPDRHAPVEYCLINTGGFCIRPGAAEPPFIKIESNLLSEEQLYTDTGMLTEATLTLMRDLEERQLLAKLAAQMPAPVVTLTDGQMELFFSSGESKLSSEYQEYMDRYKQSLTELCNAGVTTAGYVDKPASNLMVRLLEVALTPENMLMDIRRLHPLRGVTDLDLYRRILGPDERSAVYTLQSVSASNYPGPLAIHFFYLNVGRAGHPWIARVEVPAWVAENESMLAGLHAALVGQCRMMGNRPYPYALHRAHETALVTYQEKDQVTQMIALELHRRGGEVGEESNKQAAKNLGQRTRYGNHR